MLLSILTIPGWGSFLKRMIEPSLQNKRAGRLFEEKRAAEEKAAIEKNYKEMIAEREKDK
mgnify:CR=1 FL=1